MMDLEDKVFAIIDEELEKIEQAITKLESENSQLKENIENKESVLQQLEKINEGNV